VKLACDRRIKESALSGNRYVYCNLFYCLDVVKDYEKRGFYVLPLDPQNGGPYSTLLRWDNDNRSCK